MRKTFLIPTIAMAFAITSSLISCHDEDFGVSTAVLQEKAFEHDFVNEFGQPSADQNWDFYAQQMEAIRQESSTTRATMDDDITVDFNSKILGIQISHWDLHTNYAREIGVCRTFVFFHEIEYLFRNNLIKGGDVDNAIVIVENPVSEEQLSSLQNLFNLPGVRPTAEGYLNNLELHFPDECGRHKMLDLLGDLRLAGGYLNARITAYKPGHSINTKAAKALRALL